MSLAWQFFCPPRKAFVPSEPAHGGPSIRFPKFAAAHIAQRRARNEETSLASVGQIVGELPSQSCRRRHIACIGRLTQCGERCLKGAARKRDGRYLTLGDTVEFFNLVLQLKP
jgi:hypothetical protein